MKVIKKIFKKNVKFYVDEKKKTVTAVCADVNGTIFNICSFIGHQTNIRCTSVVPINDLGQKISETVTCSAEDEWNEEYGKRLALNKLYNRQFKSLLNNRLYKALDRVRNADALICNILDIITTDEFVDDLLEQIKEIEICRNSSLPLD